MDRAVEEKLEAFFTKFQRNSYKKGEIIIRAEETPSGVFYLASGTVKMYTISKKGDELVVNIFKPASFFPMSWAINDTVNLYFFEAVGVVEVWRAPRAEMLEFLKKNPDVLFDLMKRVFKGMDGMLIRMCYLMAGNAYMRLVSELLIYAKRFGHGQGPVEVSILEKDLAAQTGLTRETISREMRNLKEKQIVVEQAHKLMIQSVSKLEAELALNF